MADAVVDGLEVVEVQEQHRHGSATPSTPRKRVLHAIREQRPVGEARERVVERLVLELFLKSLAAGDVPDHDRGEWLARHPRWIFHFTPTSCSWLNAVETFFAKLTNRRLKRGVFPSLVALQMAINRFVEAHNRDPKPFVWTATPERIMIKLDQVKASMH